jgi:hypothetical protein
LDDSATPTNNCYRDRANPCARMRFRPRRPGEWCAAPACVACERTGRSQVENRSMSGLRQPVRVYRLAPTLLPVRTRNNSSPSRLVRKSIKSPAWHRISLEKSANPDPESTPWLVPPGSVVLASCGSRDVPAEEWLSDRRIAPFQRLVEPEKVDAHRASQGEGGWARRKGRRHEPVLSGRRDGSSLGPEVGRTVIPPPARHRQQTVQTAARAPSANGSNGEDRGGRTVSKRFKRRRAANPDPARCVSNPTVPGISPIIGRGTCGKPRARVAYT